MEMFLASIDSATHESSFETIQTGSELLNAEQVGAAVLAHIEAELWHGVASGSRPSNTARGKEEKVVLHFCKHMDGATYAYCVQVVNAVYFGDMVITGTATLR